MFDFQPVSLTPKAAAEVRKIMETKNIPAEYGLRVGIRGSGCAGVSLMIGFDKQKDTDQHYIIEGIPILISKHHTMYVIGKQIDFYEGEEGRGFMFTESPVNKVPEPGE